MDEIKVISEEKLRSIIGKTGFEMRLITKDYYVTVILYLLKDIDGLYFKGGTALHKIFLEYSRLSEDVDYTCTRDISALKSEVREKLITSGLFEDVTSDKDVDGFVRLIAHYRYADGKEDVVFVDLNQRGSLCRQPECHKVHHFYIEDIPLFSVATVAQVEIVAEKMAAAIGRNKPRDHFDLYMILEMGMFVDLDLVRKKCEQSGDEFSIIKMFNNAKKLKNRWDQDMLPLLVEEVRFDAVMRTLARHFSLKDEKEKQKEV